MKLGADTGVNTVVNIRAARGFTLLEAIVALVLLTTAGLALFSWINASFDGLNRVAQSNARSAAELNALEFLRTINPMARPEGQVKLGEVDMTWRARQITAPTNNLTDSREPGPFTVALYDIEVALQSGVLGSHTFSVRQMGFSRQPFGLDDTTDAVFRPGPSGTR